MAPTESPAQTPSGSPKKKKKKMRDPHPTQVPNGGCSLRQKRFTDEASNPVSRFRRRPQGRRQHNTQGRYSPRPPLSLSSVGGRRDHQRALLAVGLGFGFPESNHSSANQRAKRRKGLQLEARISTGGRGATGTAAANHHHYSPS